MDEKLLQVNVIEEVVLNGVEGHNFLDNIVKYDINYEGIGDGKITRPVLGVDEGANPVGKDEEFVEKESVVNIRTNEAIEIADAYKIKRSSLNNPTLRKVTQDNALKGIRQSVLKGSNKLIIGELLTNVYVKSVTQEDENIFEFFMKIRKMYGDYGLGKKYHVLVSYDVHEYIQSELIKSGKNFNFIKTVEGTSDSFSFLNFIITPNDYLDENSIYNINNKKTKVKGDDMIVIAVDENGEKPISQYLTKKTKVVSHKDYKTHNEHYSHVTMFVPMIEDENAVIRAKINLSKLNGEVDSEGGE